jgi:hypothetical protein
VRTAQQQHKRAAVLWLIAAAMFLITGIAGVVEGNPATSMVIVIAVAFVILSLIAWKQAGAGER